MCYQNHIAAWSNECDVSTNTTEIQPGQAICLNDGCIYKGMHMFCRVTACLLLFVIHIIGLNMNARDLLLYYAAYL